MRRLSLLLLLVPLLALARHTYHSSILELRLNPQQQQVELALKVFTDDLENALSKGRPQHLSLQDPRAQALAAAYLREHLEQALPAASGDSTFLSGQIVLTDTTWNQTIVVRYAQGGSGTAAGDSLMEAGRWTTSNGKITLLDASSSENYTGTLTSGGFSVTSKTSTLLTYSK